MKWKFRVFAVPCIVIAVLILASLACNLPINLLDNPTAATEIDLESALTAEKVDDRPGVIAELGLPDAFDISIVVLEGAQVRLESWRYYQYGTRVDFVDGEAVWTIAIEPVPDGTIFPAWYNPLAFEAGMSPDVASRAAAAASPTGTTLVGIDTAAGGEELEGGWVLAGDQILVGCDESGLVYVETVALIPQGGEQ